MADHVYKFSEIPKGERWQHFKDYYLLTTIVVILILWAVVSILKSTVFAPKPDVHLLATYHKSVPIEVWDETEEALCALPLDYNEDETVLFDFNVIHIDPNQEKTDPELYMASQNKLMASLSTAEYALQILDEDAFNAFLEMELIGTYAELPDPMGHDPKEPIKIPLKELKPFNSIETLPEGYFMTLRPRDAMQLREKQKKIDRYERQIDALLVMMEK